MPTNSEQWPEYLQNTYQIIEKLGQGGMGCVFHATKRSTLRDVAIKSAVLSANSEDASELKERLRREYYFLKLIDHPNLVKAYEIIECQERVFIVMDYVNGISLREFIRQKPANIKLKDQLAIANQMCCAVEALNSVGIVHRDIKPANFIVSRDNYLLKLLDMGLGKSLNKDLRTLTAEGEIVGTPGYLSPEQVNGSISAKSDIFSLGLSLYQFFLWQDSSPFRADSVLTTMVNICTKELPLLVTQLAIIISEKEAKIYRRLSEILAISLQKNAQARTITAQQLADEMQQLYNCLCAQEIEAKPQQGWSPTATWHFIVSSSETRPYRRPDKKATNQMAKFHKQKKRIKALVAASQERKKKFFSLPAMLIWAIVFMVIVINLIIYQRQTPTILEKISDQVSTGQNLLAAEKYADATAQWQQAAAQLKSYISDLEKNIQHAKFAALGFVYLRSKTYSCGINSNSVEEYRHLATGMEFVLIPGGTFFMGSADKGNAAYQFEYMEKPRHPVTLKPFLMAKYEVTQKVWRKVIGADPAHFNANANYYSERLRGDDKPVVCVDFADCQQFCRRTNLQLPSEAQWEYACKANSTTNYYWGDNWDKNKINSASYWSQQNIITAKDLQQSNFLKNYHSLGVGTTIGGRFPPNSYGLYDMLGNVWEWNQDYGHENYNGAPADGSPWMQPASRLRICRGGSFCRCALDCRQTRRIIISPKKQDIDLGFRVCRTIIP